MHPFNSIRSSVSGHCAMSVSSGHPEASKLRSFGAQPRRLLTKVWLSRVQSFRLTFSNFGNPTVGTGMLAIEQPSNTNVSIDVGNSGQATQLLAAAQVQACQFLRKRGQPRQSFDSPAIDIDALAAGSVWRDRPAVGRVSAVFSRRCPVTGRERSSYRLPQSSQLGAWSGQLMTCGEWWVADLLIGVKSGMDWIVQKARQLDSAGSSLYRNLENRLC